MSTIYTLVEGQQVDELVSSMNKIGLNCRAIGEGCYQIMEKEIRETLYFFPDEDDMVFKFERFFPHSGAIVRILQDELGLEFDDEFKPVKYSGDEYEGMTRDEIWTFEYEQNKTRDHCPTSFKKEGGGV